MNLEELLQRLKGAKRSGDNWTALCPAHRDKNPSLSVAEGDKGILLTCHAGCTAEAVVGALGLTLADLFHAQDNCFFTPRTTRARVHTRAPEAPENGTGLTLAEYAAAKGIPAAFLAELGLQDRRRGGKPAVAIPYLGADGRTIATRYRIALTGDRFRWAANSKPCLYGLWRLADARNAGHILVVEGESDCHTGWHHGIPAVGLPGAGAWRDERDALHFDGIDTIYVMVEPDAGGEAVLKWLSRSIIRDRVRIVRLGDQKDLSALHLAAGEGFDERWKAALAAAIPFSELEANRIDAEHTQAGEAAGDLLREPDILAKFSEAIRLAGVVGDAKTAALVYLALTSRFFSRPISIVLKGPSSAGKSYTIEKVLEFFPSDAAYVLTTMSDHALAYSEEPLEHRFLVIFEAAGLESDFATYLLRSLLSEGRVRYETVEKTAEGIKPRLIERSGPTGCLLTTTAPRLHPENETRMLSVVVSDSPQLTRAILDNLADDTAYKPDLTAWCALQTWLKGTDHFVVVPYAKVLASLVPEIAVRLRRDFHHVLTLIKAHALLHQCTREKDADGRIIAELADYAVVHRLVADIIAEGVEATVTPEIRQTVEVVRQLQTQGRDTVTVKELATALQLDPSAVSRRAAVARSKGYLKNEETRRGNPAKLTLGDSLPDEVEVLPQPVRLAEVINSVSLPPRSDVHSCTSVEPVHECTNDEGVKQTYFASERLCAGCHRPSDDDNALLPFGSASGGHNWLHRACWPAWFAKQAAA